MKKLAIITTHPIQYNAPLFKLLSLRGNIAIHVFYTWGRKVLENKFDPGFGKNIEWDIPLLDGYPYSFVDNIASKPGSHHFFGIDNPNLVYLIENWNPDAVLVFGWNFKSHLKCLRYFHDKIPVLFRGDSTLLDSSNLFKRVIKENILRLIYRYVDVALYVGTANKEYFLKYGINSNGLKFAPHAIDIMRFREHSHSLIEQAAEWRKVLGIGINDIVFLYAGKLEQKKSPDLLVKAFSYLKNQNARLVIVGNGILEDQLKAYSITNNRIHILPFQNQSRMPLVYTMADVFVLPSTGPGETWGLAVNEAMACGKPVLVSTRCGCAKDLVIPDVNGQVFNPHNKAELVEKMKSFLALDSKLAAMGQASNILIDEWTINHTAIAVEEVVLQYPRYK